MEQCCDICGDVGISDAITVCCRCKINCEHMYCMRIPRSPLLDHGDWICEECESSSEVLPLPSPITRECTGGNAIDAYKHIIEISDDEDEDEDKELVIQRREKGKATIDGGECRTTEADEESVYPAAHVLIVLDDESEDSHSEAERQEVAVGAPEEAHRSATTWQRTTNRGRFMKVKPPPLKVAPNDDIRFRGKEEVKEAYYKFEKRAVVLDRGYAEELLSHKLIVSVIQRRRWGMFACHDPLPSSWELMREFYANLHSSEKGYSWVRGKTVDFRPETLNRLLGTEPSPTDISFDENERRLNHRTSKSMCEKIANSFCKNHQPIYNKKKRGRTFAGKSFDEKLVPFTEFFFTKIKPSTHNNEASGSMLQLLYNILLGQRINVGEFICRNIMMRMEKGNRAFVYPALIRLICENSQVPLDNFVMDLPSGTPIRLPQVDLDAPFQFQPCDDPAEQSEAPVAIPERAAPQTKRQRTSVAVEDVTQHEHQPAQDPQL